MSRPSHWMADVTTPGFKDFWLDLVNRGLIVHGPLTREQHAEEQLILYGDPEAAEPVGLIE